jgi:hypothetical protein
MWLRLSYVLVKNKYSTARTDDSGRMCVYLYVHACVSVSVHIPV